MSVWEQYAATVVGIDAEGKRGGIYVKCAELMGDEDTKYPEVVEPVFDWGWFYIPDIGEEVEVEVLVSDGQAEDVSGQAFLEQGVVRWRGKRFAADEGEAPALPHEQFTTNFGKRRGFATPAGHVFFFDDTAGSEEVTLSWKDGSSFVQIDKDGNVNISAGGDADQALVRGNELDQWIQQEFLLKYAPHAHNTVFGPSGPPIVQILPPPPTYLSVKGKVK